MNFLHEPRPLPEKTKFQFKPGYLITALVFVAYLLWVSFARAGDETFATVADTVFPMASTTGMIWSVWGYRKRNAEYRARGGKRGTLSANLLSLGLLFYVIGGDILCFIRWRDHVKPASSIADPFLLLGAILSVAGLLFFPSRRLSAVVRTRLFLDSLMVMAALVTFSWYFTLGPTILSSSSTVLGTALNAIYPLTDLVMMFCVLAVSSHTGDDRLREARNLLCLAVLTLVVGDVCFLYSSIHGTYVAGNAYEAGYVVAPFFSGQGILSLRNYRAREGTKMEQEGRDVQRPSSLWRSLLPYALVPAVACLMIQVWRAHVHPGLANGVYIGAAVLIALIMVRQVFAIVENSRLYRFLQDAYRDLEALATTDGMTGLWNHRTFQEQFRSELSHSKESGRPVSLLLIDVDRFKAYNDQFGHPAGDEALRKVAQVLKLSVRESDLPARYGGEEFAAVLPGTSESEALVIAERIRAACEAETFPRRSVTLSIGVATSLGGEPDQVIEGADQALYVAKHRGRNQVALASACLDPDDSNLETCELSPRGYARRNRRRSLAQKEAALNSRDVDGAPKAA